MKIDWKPDEKKLRQFGVGGCVILFVVGLIFAWRFGVFEGSERFLVSGVFFGLSILLGLGALVCPKWLKYPFFTLSVITFPIGFILNLIILSVIYYLLITPFALVFRLIKRDALNRRSTPSDSYWITREKPRTSESYLRQF